MIVGGDFNINTGEFTIPALSVPSGNCGVLTAEVLVTNSALVGYPYDTEMVVAAGACAATGSTSQILTPSIPGGLGISKVVDCKAVVYGLALEIIFLIPQRSTPVKFLGLIRVVLLQLSSKKLTEKMMVSKQSTFGVQGYDE